MAVEEHQGEYRTQESSDGDRQKGVTGQWINSPRRRAQRSYLQCDCKV